MPTSITLINGADVRPVIPSEDGKAATAEGPCPCCGVKPFALAGAGMRIADDDRAYEADGQCVACGKPVGIIRAEVDTLFGLREDQAVLTHGRARVY
jgi:hypothetical protein